MKKVFLALALTTFVGSMATSSYAAVTGVKIEKKDDDKRKKKKGGGGAKRGRKRARTRKILLF